MAGLLGNLNVDNLETEMRWNKPKPKSSPVDGEVRIRRVFAWKPTEIGDEIAWLEFFEIRELYVKANCFNGPYWVELSRNFLDKL